MEIAADRPTATDGNIAHGNDSTVDEEVVGAKEQSVANADADGTEPDECRVKFWISPLDIAVSVYGCDGYRGVGASFDGSYYLLTPQPGDAPVKDPSDHGGMCGVD